MNFCRINFLATLDIKLRVLHTCVCASLIYGCETWDAAKFTSIETSHRQGLRSALSIGATMNNEITYIESGEYPLYIRITMQQLTFWLSLKSVLRNPDHYITKLVNLAEHHNVSYIKYYKSLEHKDRNSDSCNKVLQNEFKAKTAEKIKADATKDV